MVFTLVHKNDSTLLIFVKKKGEDWVVFLSLLTDELCMKLER